MKGCWWIGLLLCTSCAMSSDGPGDGQPERTVVQFDECSDGSGSGSGGGQCWPPNPSCDFTVNCGTWGLPYGDVMVSGRPGDYVCCQTYNDYYGCTYVWADCSTTTSRSMTGSSDTCWPYDPVSGC